MTDQPIATTPAETPPLPAGRTPPLDPRDADRLFWQGVALFNGARYWHAHEAWETLWRAAPEFLLLRAGCLVVVSWWL